MGDFSMPKTGENYTEKHRYFKSYFKNTISAFYQNELFSHLLLNILSIHKNNGNCVLCINSQTAQ